MMRNRQRQLGMTLLEVMLAVSIAVLLLGGVFGFYRYAMGMRQALMSKSEEVRFRQALMVRMTSELRCAVPYPYLNLGIRGTSNSLEMITTAIPAQYTWEELPNA